MGGRDTSKDQAALIAALRDPAAYPHPADAVEVIETHISTVLLAGDHAYKIKKPVDLGFADFSTLERRHAACDAEIRLNRRTAPDLYLEVAPITCEAGGPRIGGDGEPIEYAVHMHRFPNDARLDHLARAGKLDDVCIDRLAATIAAFHAACARAPSASAYGTPGQIGRWTSDTANELRRLVAAHLPDQNAAVGQLLRWTEQEFVRRTPVFAARRAAGWVRECHGDLHLANVASIEGRPVPFDCIEFNPELRFIDVMSDVAFAWMDLLDHDLPQLAARFLDRYVEATGDYEGLAVVRFYAVYRALVRALVAMIRCGQPERSSADRLRDQSVCVRYLQVAERLTRLFTPMFVLTCGVTGSGKTTIAQQLLEHLGAVRVRSDIERKRRAGLAATDHRREDLRHGLYDAAATRATYEAIGAAAAAIVDAGFCTIVDATFQRRADRHTFAELAQRHGARFALVVCDASEPTLRTRIAARQARGDDASDATLAVLADQLAHFERPTADEGSVYRIDTDADAATVAARSLPWRVR